MTSCSKQWMEKRRSCLYNTSEVRIIAVIAYIFFFSYCTYPTWHWTIVIDYLKNYTNGTVVRNEWEKNMSYLYNTSEIIIIVVIAYIVSYNASIVLPTLDCRHWLSLEFILWVVYDELFINFQAFLVIHAMLEPKLISTKCHLSFVTAPFKFETSIDFYVHQSYHPII
jgi:hypothetical protein